MKAGKLPKKGDPTKHNPVVFDFSNLKAKTDKVDVAISKEDFERMNQG